MSLSPGTRIGPFEILGSLGEGGMGEVYRARDPRLDRDVAIKILPTAFAADADRLARFQREAKVLASLNHPNIAGIHGLEESAGLVALVMELVPGEDLSQRIAHGAIPLDDALPIAKQIADALEAAHEQGIIHRDLKPANIKVRPDGTVKVLDFGLAKALDPAAGSGADVTASPTITSPAMTRLGMILGTAAYMSPEQARGRVVDRRADIWAFGAVVFEMLTGRRPFEGDDIATTLAAVINKDPDWTALPAATPPRLSTLLRRCLKKDPKARLRDIGEGRLQIDELLSGASDDGAPAPSLGSAARSSRWLLAAAIGVLAIGLVLATAAIITVRRGNDASAAANPVQFSIVPLANTWFGGPVDGGTGVATQIAVSPDGRQIVFVAGARNTYQIYLRPLAGRTPVLIPGTEGGTFPFWSPDSQFIAFFAGGKLKTVSIAGGSVSVLCNAQFGRGGSWNRDGVIVFAPGQAGNTPGVFGLLRVSSQGGEPTVVTRVDPAAALTRHRWPYFLPDGRHFLYTEVSGPAGPASTPSVIRIGSLDSTEPRVTLVEAESSAVYGSGHILFVRDGSLFAVPFDPETRQAKGEAVRLAEQVSWEGGRYASVSLSQNGVLAYGHDYSQALSELTWFDRAGRTLGTLGAPARYADVALSPDQKLVASSIRTGSPENRDIWIVDVARNVPTRLTTDPGIDSSPVWSPDSRRIAYSAQRSAKSFLRVQSIDGSSADESLFETTGNLVSLLPSSRSMDAKFIAHSRLGAFPRTADVWAIPTAGDGTPLAIANTAFLENSGSFSPNGHWVAYAIDDGVDSNVVIQAFPSGGGKYRVSQDGGSNPTWRADGKELFYLRPDGALMAVPMDADGRAGAARALFEIGTTQTREQFSINGQIYAATKDGERFLVNTRSTQSPLAPLTVLVNWVASMQK